MSYQSEFSKCLKLMYDKDFVCGAAYETQFLNVGFTECFLTTSTVTIAMSCLDIHQKKAKHRLVTQEEFGRMVTRPVHECVVSPIILRFFEAAS